MNARQSQWSMSDWNTLSLKQLQTPEYDPRGSLSANIFSGYHPHLKPSLESPTNRDVYPLNIESWDTVEEEFGRRPYLIRPTITFKPSPEMLNFAQRNNNFIKVKIQGTGYLYDTFELWGRMYYMDDREHVFIALRTIFMGYPKDMGTVQLLPQYTLRDVPQEMRQIAYFG